MARWQVLNMHIFFLGLGETSGVHTEVISLSASPGAKELAWEIHQNVGTAWEQIDVEG